jgi:ankyrin repeat protein
VFACILFIITGLGATEQQLSNAVRRGDLTEVKKYLDLGFSQEIVDNAGRNLLLQSAVYGHMHLVEFFIGKRANIAKVDHDGNTILHILAESKSPKAPALIQLALRNGAYIGAKNYSNQTAAAKAIVKGNSATFKAFIDSGYDKNSTEENMPVVMYAYLKGRQPIAKILIEAGADINRQDSAGDTLMHLAASANDTGTIKSLLDAKAKINIKNTLGKTPLMLALEKNRIPIAETLIKSGADMSITDRQKRNILHYIASISQANKLLSAIPTQGLNIDAKDENGNTPLLIAAESSQWNNVDLFLAMGAQVNISNRAGKTPLLFAGAKGNLATVKNLMEKGADVKKADNAGMTLIHYLAANRTKGALALLSDAVSKGALVNAASTDGSSPIGISIAEGNSGAFSVFLELGADKDFLEGKTTPLHIFAYEKKRKDFSKTLIEKGADIKKTSTEGKTILHLAASQDDWQFVNFVLGFNPDINARDSGGLTPLLAAIDKSAIRSAGILMEKGADVNVKDRIGRNAIHYLAAAKNATGLLSKLEGSKLDINAKDSTGRTPLAMAVENGRTENVEYLLNIGADVNGIDHAGNALILAAYEKSRPMLNLFINRGAKLNVKKSDGKTLLLLGLENNDTSLVQLLADKGINVNEQQANGKYPLEFAIEKKQTVNVKTLLDAKADHTIKTSGGDPLLSLTIEKRNETVAGLLLQKGADPNGKNRAGRNHLFHSLDENQPAIFKLLIDFNADINEKDANGTPLIFTATDKNRTLFLKYILDKNVDINATDSNLNTAVIVAAWKGFYEPVKMLVDKGADINRNGQDGENALFKAIDAPGNSGVPIINLLAKQGANIKAVNKNGDTLLHRSIKERKLNLFELFLKLGADPNSANKNGDTLLMQLSNIDAPSGKGAALNKMIAENKTSIKLIQTLLKNGADPNTTNKYGNTALNLARVKRNYEIVTALLSGGAQVNLQDKHGNTVLKKEVMDYVGNYRMLDSLKQSTVKMIDIFMSAGGDINIKDKYGLTPLSHCAKELNEKNAKKVKDIVQLLMSKGAKKDIPDNTNKTALDYARTSGDSELIQILTAGY